MPDLNAPKLHPVSVPQPNLMIAPVPTGLGWVSLPDQKAVMLTITTAVGFNAYVLPLANVDDVIAGLMTCRAEAASGLIISSDLPPPGGDLPR